MVGRKLFRARAAVLFLGILLLRHFSVAVSAQDEAGPSGNGSTATWLSPLTRGATKLLCDNYRTELEATIPSPLIDAHQESTTSVMVAEAWAHVDQQRARAELLSIFRGQWENGLVPTVRYAPGYDADFVGGTFLPGPRGWGGGDGHGNASSPPTSAGGANTSALAALPLHAEAALRIFDLSARDADARLWLQSLFPALMRYHDYLHGSRGDPETGLVYVLHPWETEVSADSALWSSLLTEARSQAANESWTPPVVPPSVTCVPGFPGEEAFDAALFLSECSARNDFVDSDVQRECPFLLQDVQFNAALVRSDKALLELAGILEATRSGWQGKVYTPEEYERLEERAERAELGTAMAHLWSAADGAFLSRYTSTVTHETFLVRPATSSGFSALLSPGLPPFKANAAVDVLLSPGDLSFRCGNHPVTGLECGDGTPVDTRRPHSSNSSSSSLEGGGSVDPDRRRVWVFHNFLAERGFRRQSLTGLSVWVANSTLSLLAPSLLAEPAPPEHEPADGDRRGGGGGGGGGTYGEFVDGDDYDYEYDDDDDNVSVFRFHRGFDGESGLPLAGAEGNRSSLAAAVSVLLLLGDEPDGGNDFPPITHATLFVLVAIELAFSFAMGVSCLIFSVNLVRKLREEDHTTSPYLHRHRLSSHDSGGNDSGNDSGSGGYFTGPGVVRGAKAEDGERYSEQRDSVSGSGARSSSRRRSSARGSTDAAAAAAAATEFARRRGIGSLLSRKAGSRLDRFYYGGRGVDDDGDSYGGSESDDGDYMETAVAMTTAAAGGGVANGGRVDDAAADFRTGWRSADTSGDSTGERPDSRNHVRINNRRGGFGISSSSSSSSSGGEGMARWGDQSYRDRRGLVATLQEIPPHRRQGEAPTAAATTAAGRRRSARRGGGGGRGGSGRGARAQEDDEEEASAALLAGSGGGGGDGGGGGEDGSGGGRAGLFDVFKPFYASFKFW